MSIVDADLLGLTRGETIKSRLTSDDEEQGRNKDKVHYTFNQILDALGTINAGRLVSTRGEKDAIDRSKLLNPYADMINHDSDKEHASVVCKNDSRFLRKSVASNIYFFVEVEFSSFEDVLPGITKKNLFDELYKHKVAGVMVRERRIIENDTNNMTDNMVYFSRSPERLRPLSVERYNLFARNYYKKMCYPKFRKRFVHGIIAGSAQITKELVHIKKGLKVQSVTKRMLGMVIANNSHNERVGLAIETDDGVYRIVKRSNSKNGHVWELVFSTNPLFRVKYYDDQLKKLQLSFVGHGKKKFINEAFKNGKRIDGGTMDDKIVSRAILYSQLFWR